MCLGALCASHCALLSLIEEADALCGCAGRGRWAVPAFCTEGTRSRRTGPRRVLVSEVNVDWVEASQDSASGACGVACSRAARSACMHPGGPALAPPASLWALRSLPVPRNSASGAQRDTARVCRGVMTEDPLLKCPARRASAVRAARAAREQRPPSVGHDAGTTCDLAAEHWWDAAPTSRSLAPDFCSVPLVLTAPRTVGLPIGQSRQRGCPAALPCS